MATRASRPFLQVVLGSLAALLALVALLAPTFASAKASSNPALSKLLSSRELWATINVCNPADQPYTVGIRGAMPGDGQSGDRMYMSFRLQYLNPVTGRWAEGGNGTSSPYILVGSSSAARQDGSSFQLVKSATNAVQTLRGVVDFQWRRGRTVLQSAERTTSAGHRSLAGADPASYSAARCVMR